MEDETESSLSLSHFLCQEDDSSSSDKDIEQRQQESSEIDDEYIKMLIERENNFGIKNPMEEWLKSARFFAIKWIRKAREVLGFQFQTAYLSVTYFDRFLSKRDIDRGKDWVIQSLSVACLRLAAKMEEIKIPSLSEFRIENYDFEHETIHRMELQVLTTLDWRMHSITPFAYLHYFITKFHDESLPINIESKSVKLLFSMIQETNSMNHRRPSVIAAAAVLAISNKSLTQKMVELMMNSITSCASLENDQVFSCYIRMQKLQLEKSKTFKREMSSSDVSTHPFGTKRRQLKFDDDDHDHDQKGKMPYEK